VKPNTLEQSVTPTPEASAYIGVEFNVPEWRKESDSTQYEGDKLQNEAEFQNAVIPRKRLNLLLLECHAAVVLTFLSPS